MAVVIKQFSFVQGPFSTPLSKEEIAQTIAEVALRRRGSGLKRRVLSRVNDLYGPFEPTEQHETTALDGSRLPDARYGWRRHYVEFSPHLGTTEVGWRVIFEVFDTGPSRHVVASVRGESDRNEARRLVREITTRFS